MALVILEDRISCGRGVFHLSHFKTTFVHFGILDEISLNRDVNPTLSLHADPLPQLAFNSNRAESHATLDS